MLNDLINKVPLQYIDVSVTVGILAVVNLLIIIFLSRAPVLIEPVGKTRLYSREKHNRIIWMLCFLQIFDLCLLCNLLIPVFSNTTISTNFSWILLVNLFIAIPCSLLLFLLWRVFKPQKSIRPFHCSTCDLKLVKLSTNDLSNYLNMYEKVALSIGSVAFEGWSCKHCNHSFTSPLIHIRGYVNSSNKYRFCESCQELTMLRTSTVTLRKATASQNGELLTTFTCQYSFCKRQKYEKSTIYYDDNNNNNITLYDGGG